MSATLPRVIEIPLGVTVAREKIDSPWADHIWRPVSVFLDAEPIVEWRPLHSVPGAEHFHVATVNMELHRTETPGYLINLASGEPTVYVVLRHGGANDADGSPVHVHLVTASPHDAEAYGINADEIIGQVTMPEPLVELLLAFVDTHHIEVPFKKRKRTRKLTGEDYKFGQEPLQSLRARMKRAGVERDET